MMKGSDNRIQDKKAKLFNEWERFTSTNGELIESYYHRFSKLMNDFKRNKHFPEKITSNLKFLNNLQPEWRRHVEVNELRAERLERAHDPLALMENSNNPYNYTIAQPDMNFGQKEKCRWLKNAVQNQGVQNVGNQNGLIVVLGIANLNPNQIGNGNVVVARDKGNGIQLQAKEFDFMAAAGDLKEIEEVNTNCILMANLEKSS
ncbi:hypothetical protein Tco_0397592 [Tanacetum coccineum]